MESIIAIVVASTAIVGLLYQQFGVLGDIKERLTSVETKMELFWTAIQSKTIDMLKSPTNLVKDGLLDKLRNGDCTRDDCHTLYDMLIAEMKAKKPSDGKMLAYCIVLGRINQRLFDLENRGDRNSRTRWLRLRW